MHIPDGYLSPATCAVLGVAMLPAWKMALNRVSRSLKSRQVPFLAIGAAFSFVIMMFNIPVPGGTSAHAVGAVLLAILLGPWAAVIGVSIALIIQALMFSDGGVLAIGANCFNMAVAMPLTGYAVYWIIAGKSGLLSKRRLTAVFAAGYVGINVSALLTGIELGLQPFLHSLVGGPVYCPYNLSQALPAMGVAHLLVAGPIEGLVTMLVFSYLRQRMPELFQVRPKTFGASPISPEGGAAE